LDKVIKWRQFTPLSMITSIPSIGENPPKKDSRTEPLNQIDLFAQSQRDCAPKPRVAERARLPWVLAPATPSTPKGLRPARFSKLLQIDRGSL
jgi:hypothetical protein